METKKDYKSLSKQEREKLFLMIWKKLQEDLNVVVYVEPELNSENKIITKLHVVAK